MIISIAVFFILTSCGSLIGSKAEVKSLYLETNDFSYHELDSRYYSADGEFSLISELLMSLIERKALKFETSPLPYSYEVSVDDFNFWIHDDLVRVQGRDFSKHVLLKKREAKVLYGFLRSTNLRTGLSLDQKVKFNKKINSHDFVLIKYGIDNSKGFLSGDYLFTLFDYIKQKKIYYHDFLNYLGEPFEVVDDDAKIIKYLYRLKSKKTLIISLVLDDELLISWDFEIWDEGKSAVKLK
jgi:hypothetical protein